MTAIGFKTEPAIIYRLSLCVCLVYIIAEFIQCFTACTREDWILFGSHMDRQTRTGDRELVKSRKMTCKSQVLPWWLERGEVKTTEKNALAPVGLSTFLSYTSRSSHVCRCDAFVVELKRYAQYLIWFGKGQMVLTGCSCSYFLQLGAPGASLALPGHNIGHRNSKHH
jgi:hypothetical protein